MKSKSLALSQPRGFSLVEMLGIVAIVGVLAGVGYSYFGGIANSATERKLKTEVATLNSAVASYLGFGGNLDSVDTPEGVITQLRSIAKSDVAKRIPGLSSSMVDPRISAVVKTDEQAGEGELRVVWNNATKRFETATSGTGITSFYLNEDNSDIEKTEETRKFEFLYAKEDTWVWDYSEVAASAATGPTPVTTTTPGTVPTGTPPSTGTVPTPGPVATPLSPPIYSKPGGSYSIRDYDFTITLANPNPAGSSVIYYQTNYGPWEKYAEGTVLTVAPDDLVNSQAISISDDYSDSSRVNENYLASPVQLNAPDIQTSADSFGVFENRLVGVVIQDTNPGDETQLEYKIGDGPWIPYTGYLLLDRVDFEGGAVITARATSENPYYLSSDNTIDIVAADPVQMLGAATGLFNNPDGSKSMVTNLPYKNSASDYFEWGRITNSYGQSYYGFDKSWMDFDGLEVSDLEMGDRFHLGNLDYYNGKFLADTGADAVDLDLALSFEIAGTVYNTSFDYEFELINTINDNNDILGWPSADYVRIDHSNSASEFKIKGVTFELVLEFGNPTSDGFTNFDEFHVREQRGATSALYGTIIDRSVSQGTVNSNGQANGNSAPASTAAQSGLSALFEWLGSVGQGPDQDQGQGQDQGLGLGLENNDGLGLGVGGL